VPLAFDGYLLIDECEVIVGSNIVDDPLKTLHRYVLGHVGFVQDLNLKSPIRLRVYE